MQHPCHLEVALLQTFSAIDHVIPPRGLEFWTKKAPWRINVGLPTWGDPLIAIVLPSAAAGLLLPFATGCNMSIHVRVGGACASTKVFVALHAPAATSSQRDAGEVVVCGVVKRTIRGRLSPVRLTGSKKKCVASRARTIQTTLSCAATKTDSPKKSTLQATAAPKNNGLISAQKITKVVMTNLISK